MIHELLTRLEQALKADRVAVSALIVACRVPVADDSKLLGASSEVICTEDEQGGYNLSTLGLLNGLHGSETHDIVGVIEDNRLIGFRLAERSKEPLLREFNES